MDTLITSIKRQPLVAFFGLVFALVGVTTLLLADRPALLPFALTLLPTTAALVVVATTEGRAGVTALLRRLAIWRVGLPWYGVVLGLPVLRLRGDYLAIVTLGFAEVIRALLNNLDKPINFTNGPRGITPIQRPPLFFQGLLEVLGAKVEPAAVYPLYFYFLVLVLVAAVVLVSRRLEDSAIGRAWKAIREDETAAATVGVPVVKMKLFAFAVGAAFGSVTGMIFAAKQVFINPESFTFMESIGVLAMVILGGAGSIPGVVLGAMALTILNLQLLKGLSLWLNGLRQSGTLLYLPLLGDFDPSQIPAQFEPAKYERLVFGAILIVMMIFRPQGILPARGGGKSTDGAAGS